MKVMVYGYRKALDEDAFKIETFEGTYDEVLKASFKFSQGCGSIGMRTLEINPETDGAPE